MIININDLTVARKKVPELVRRQSLSEYNETIRNEYTSSSTKKEEQSIIKSSNQCMLTNCVYLYTMG